MSPTIIYGSFGAATVAFLLMLGLVAPIRPHTVVSRWFLGATAISVIWALAQLSLIGQGGPVEGWLIAFDAIHLASWVVFVVVLAESAALFPSSRAGRYLRFFVLALATVVFLLNTPLAGAFDPKLRFVGVLLLPLLGLLGLEQIYRNATYEEQWFLKPLALGVGGIFIVDIFVYSQALLFGVLGTTSWALRGFANAAVVPMLVIAAKRQPGWGETIFVSRQVVYYSTTFLAVGCYLLVMAVGGYVIGLSGIAWGAMLQAIFLFLACVLLGVILFTRALRNRLKVFIAKHFYRNRYDYREEWLRLMKTLASGERQESLSQRSVRALADIIDSTGGELWWLTEKGSFEPRASWGAPHEAKEIMADDIMVRFLQERGWVVDTLEADRDAEKYTNAFVDTPYVEASPSIYVPLVLDGNLIGIIRLDRPPGIGNLGFEDHDLLKTAGQQAAIFLAQERDQEKLSETRQFEAFSRLTAFLMHDLKNMISQQELVVGNAKKFRHRPEFIDDAMKTIDASVKRMQSLLERLQAAGRREQAARVDVQRVIRDAVCNCEDRMPKPIAARQGDGPLWVSVDREKLTMALTHAIRNAQDATERSGRIEVRAERNNGAIILEVQDNGSGMDDEFVRHHLFKPFESTKGAQGMGIGAYQIRETIHGAGGDIEVESRRGSGTTIRMVLPAVGENQASPAETADEPG